MSTTSKTSSEPYIKIFFRDGWWFWIVELDARILGGQHRDLSEAMEAILVSRDSIKEINPNPRREP